MTDRMRRLARFFFSAGLMFILPQNSFSQNYSIYFGDLHQHSIYSHDSKTGAKNPAAAFDYARTVANIDFMALTDHTNGLSETNFQDVRSAAAVYDDPALTFVAIAGQELGSLGGTGYGHMNIFEPLTRADDPGDANTRFNLQNAYQFLIDNDLNGQFNHPGTDNGNSNFLNLDYFESADLNMNAIEVLSGFRSGDFERYYLQALEKGWHVGATGNQDNHAGAYGNRLSSGNKIYLTGVLADSLTKPKILDAIRNRRTYAFETKPATDRIFLTKFTADGNWMGEEFDNDDNRVDFEIAAQAQNNFLSVQLSKNNRLLEIFFPEGNSFNWQIADEEAFGETFYFVKIVQADTDLLWSSPIWVNSSGEYTPPANPVTPISELRQVLQNGVPTFLGRANVTVRGVATVGREFGGPGYIQDETGGVAVFGSLFTDKTIPGVALEFEVTGVVSLFNGLTELIPYTVTRLSSSSFPESIQVTAEDIAVRGEAFEGKLVTVFGATISGQYPASGASANLTISDATGSAQMRIDGDTNIDGTTAPANAVDITGVIGQFDTSEPYSSGYQLLPRSLADITLATAVEDEKPPISPTEFALSQNYPNPFNPETLISFSVPKQARVVLEIYNGIGQRIAVLAEETFRPGVHEVLWNGRDESGAEAPSGVYFYRMQTEEFSSVRKMLLLR